MSHIWVGWAGAIAFAFFCSSLAQAASSNPSLPTSPESLSVAVSAVIERSLSTYPILSQRRAEKEAAGQEAASAWWGRFPSLSAIGRREEKTEITDRTVRLSLPLWASGGIQARINETRARAEAAEAEVLSSQQAVIVQAGELFFDLLRLEHAVLVAAENLQEHQRLVDLIERRVKSEYSPAADLVIARSRLQLAVSEEIQVIRQRDTTLSTLQQFLGEPLHAVIGPHRPTWITQALEQRIESDTQRRETEEWVTRARTFSPELLQSRKREVAAAAEVTAVRARALPRLSLVYEHNWRSEGQLNEDEGLTFMLVQIDTGAGLSAVDSVRAAQSRRVAAQESISLLERQLAAQTRNLLLDTESFRSEIVPARIASQATADTMASTLRQYQIGRKGWLDVLNAQREKTQALFSLADVVFRYEKSRLRLGAITGDIRPDRLGDIRGQ